MAGAATCSRSPASAGHSGLAEWRVQGFERPVFRASLHWLVVPGGVCLPLTGKDVCVFEGNTVICSVVSLNIQKHRKTVFRCHSNGCAWRTAEAGEQAVERRARPRRDSRAHAVCPRGAPCPHSRWWACHMHADCSSGVWLRWALPALCPCGPRGVKLPPACTRTDTPVQA